MVYTCTSGMFNLDIKNPEEVKKIQVKTSSKYGKADICTHDQKKLQDNFIIGTDISIDGARYAKNIADAKADNTSGYFQIHWKAADAVYDELDKNPDMDLSKIHDTISFIVEFRNGDTATSIVDISFDAEGYMYAKCKSYNYVVKS